MTPTPFDRKRWTVHDVILMQQLLSSLHEALLRELYDAMMHCFDVKPHPIGPVMYILDNHIRLDPGFVERQDDYDRFRSYAREGLLGKAKETYHELLNKEIPEQDSWDIRHIIQLGQVIMKLAQRIQKRYRNNPEIMGYGNPWLYYSSLLIRKFRVNPSDILLKCVLPLSAEDSRDMIMRVIEQARERGAEIELQDGFDLYKELAAIRRLYTSSLPEYEPPGQFCHVHHC
jgi:hypothetical protein